MVPIVKNNWLKGLHAHEDSYRNSHPILFCIPRNKTGFPWDGRCTSLEC